MRTRRWPQRGSGKATPPSYLVSRIVKKTKKEKKKKKLLLLSHPACGPGSGSPHKLIPRQRELFNPFFSTRNHHGPPHGHY